MEPRSLTYITSACAGELVQGSPDSVVLRVCTDTRQLRPGDLFVAIEGENFDGHQFLGDAVTRGATAVVVSRSKRPARLDGCGIIVVDGTRIALGRLAARYRQDFDLPVVAVGGSNGKTTTKELLAAVLGERFPTLRSEASFNNDIGVPITLLKLEHSHGAAVLEVGTNHPGELAPLVRAIAPKCGIITSIGREHLEFFGDLNGVIEEEGWLAELLPAHGRLYLNGDSPGADRIAARTKASLVRVGLADGNDWRASGMVTSTSGVAFDVECPDPAISGRYEIRLLGRHQVVNALFALAVGGELGMNSDELRRGLLKCEPAKMRLQLWTADGVQVLDDCYNANADSMRAALEVLMELPCRGTRTAVLGDMAELGGHSVDAHAEVGRYAAELRVDRLIAVGRQAAEIARAARESGLIDVTEFESVDEAAREIGDVVEPGDIVLLKGSRSMRLERVGERLRRRQV